MHVLHSLTTESVFTVHSSGSSRRPKTSTNDDDDDDADDDVRLMEPALFSVHCSFSSLTGHWSVVSAALKSTAVSRSVLLARLGAVSLVSRS